MLMLNHDVFASTSIAQSPLRVPVRSLWHSTPPKVLILADLNRFGQLAFCTLIHTHTHAAAAAPLRPLRVERSPTVAYLKLKATESRRYTANALPEQPKVAAETSKCRQGD